MKSAISALVPRFHDQSSSNDKNRFPLSGSIDEIGNDIQRVKDNGSRSYNIWL